jgi:hypothetical protein
VQRSIEYLQERIEEEVYGSDVSPMMLGVMGTTFLGLAFTFMRVRAAINKSNTY